MGNRIYITEEIANQLQDITSSIDELPKDIKMVLKNHKTSLGMHPSFPPEEEIPFDAMMTQKRFEEVIETIHKFDITDFSINGIQKELQACIEKCKSIEKNFKEQLEALCYNHIIDLFEVPDGLVDFHCSLVEKVDDSKAQFQGNPEPFDFEDIKHRTRLSDEVYKRRMINALITGGAMRLSNISKELIGELYEMNADLPMLYRKISAINDYILFSKNNMGLSEKKKKQGGISYLTIGNEHTKNKIVAEAEIFPILLHESIRGFLEMFAAYGLPASKKECAYVMSKADFIEAEPWDMRIGPALWDFLINKFQKPDTIELPLILTILFSQSTKKFNSLLQEIFGETNRGERMIQKILMKAKEEFETDDFEKTMDKKRTEQSLISDGYFRPEDF